MNPPSQLTDYLREKGELTNTTVGELLDKKDRSQYAGSLIKSIFALAHRQKPVGVAGAVSKFLETINPAFRTDDYEIVAPLDMLVQQRALGATTGSAGGFLIGLEVLPVELILRPISLILKLGGQLLTGLKSNLVVLRQLTEATPYQWMAEGDTATLNDESFGQVTISPKRLGGGTQLSRQLEFQTIPRMSEHVADSLGRGIFVEYDKQSFQGTGSLGTPTGLFQTASVPTETFSGAATLATVADIETKLTNQNVTDAHRDDGKRFIVRADELLTAFLELERSICIHLLTC